MSEFINNTEKRIDDLYAFTKGITNKEKARARQAYAVGKIGRKELLESESASRCHH